MKSISVIVAAFVLTAVGVCHAAPPPSGAKAISHRAFSGGDYQSFVKNWDDHKYPVFCASISSLKQWNAVFSAAAVMGQKLPFNPKQEVFDKEQLLLIARVLPNHSAQSLALESISMTGTNLEFRYRHDPTKEGKASFSVKQPLGAFIPKGDYHKAIFIENGKPIATIDLAAGEFASPKPAGD